jgi:uncharacterized protein
MPPSEFLIAEWRHLAMINYDIDAAVLAPLVPAGTELDRYNGRAIVSLVGFLFLNTRVLGVPVPFHRDFEEVNLRFYVRRKADDGWRRAVVFVKELVPKRAIAAIARAMYWENYLAVPTSHSVEPGRVEYVWQFDGAENSIRMTVHGEPHAVETGSEAEFITEHYWGYSSGGRHRTTEYQVAHPRWRVWNADHSQFVGDVAGLYGKQFVGALREVPASAFLAEGSEVTVFKGVSLDL